MVKLPYDPEPPPSTSTHPPTQDLFKRVTRIILKLINSDTENRKDRIMEMCYMRHQLSDQKEPSLLKRIAYQTHCLPRWEKSHILWEIFSENVC